MYSYIVSGEAAFSSGGRSRVGLICLSDTAVAKVDSKVNNLSNTGSAAFIFTSCSSDFGPWNTQKRW